MKWLFRLRHRGQEWDPRTNDYVSEGWIAERQALDDAEMQKWRERMDAGRPERFSTCLACGLMIDLHPTPGADVPKRPGPLPGRGQGERAYRRLRGRIVSAEKVRPICDGFAWIGQKFSTCDDCGHPAWDHDGMKRLRPDAGPFNDDAWEVRAWDDKVIATWLTHNLIDRARAVALLAHIDGPECGPDRAT